MTDTTTLPHEPSANPPRKKLWATGVRVLFSAALLTWIARNTNWSQVGEAFANLRVECWLGAVGILIGTQFLSSKRWQLFARELRFERSVPKLTAYYFIGMFFNLLLPTSVGGDVVRAWYLDAGAKRRLAAFASVLLDRLNGLAVLIVLAVLGVFMTQTPLPAWVSWSVFALAALAATGFLALPVLARVPYLPTVRREQLATVVSVIHQPRVLITTTGLSFLVQVANVVLVWWIGLGLGMDVPFAYYWILVPMVTLLTILPLSLNGMGVREGGTVLFLSPLGVPQETALTLAFLWFAVFGIASLMGGAVYLWEGQAATASQESKDGSFNRRSDQGREGQPRSAA